MLEERHTIRVAAGLLVFLLALVLATASSVSGAGPIVVNTTVDDVEVNGNCTLREAIIASCRDGSVAIRKSRSLNSSIASLASDPPAATPTILSSAGSRGTRFSMKRR